MAYLECAVGAQKAVRQASIGLVLPRRARIGLCEDAQLVCPKVEVSSPLLLVCLLQVVQQARVVHALGLGDALLHELEELRFSLQAVEQSHGAPVVRWWWWWWR